MLVSGRNLSHRPGEISGDQERPAETNEEEEVLSSPFKSLRILLGPSRIPPGLFGVGGAERVERLSGWRIK